MVDQLDQDRLDFERMLGCMAMDIENLANDIELDEEEEEEKEKEEEEKMNTAQITPELIEKSKKLAEEEKQKKAKEAEQNNTADSGSD